MTTTEPAGIYEKGEFIALLSKDGIKPSKAAIRIDELMPLLSRDDLKELRDWIVRHELMDPDTDPELRRELLSRFEKCPCCDRWLGHNNPPADAGEPEPTYRRQPAFNFGPKPKD